MAFIVRTATKIRNNWKKSTFAFAALSYGISYGIEKYEINELMKEVCAEAAKYGDVKLPLSRPSQKVLVILNPAANKRSSQKQFEKYCEPILHLAGISVEIVRTDSEGHARRYVEELSTLPDAILVAGGDGTLSEAITGLFRRSTSDSCPFGILPVGRTNAVGAKLFNVASDSTLEKVRGLTRASIAVVRGRTERRDIMKIEIVSENKGEEDTEDTPGPKPVYAVGSLKWGAFRDIVSMRDQYWYTGPLREYTAFLFNSFSSKVQWNCAAKIAFTPPCSGCSNCYVPPSGPAQAKSTSHWLWRLLRPKQNQMSTTPDLSKAVNDECVQQTVVEISPSEVIFFTENLEGKTSATDAVDTPKLSIRIGEYEKSSLGFMTKSWSRLRTNADPEPKEIFAARTLELTPKLEKRDNASEKEKYFAIDNEDYEVKPVRITVLPKAITLYTL